MSADTFLSTTQPTRAVNTRHTLHNSNDLEMPGTINCAIISLAISVHVRPSVRPRETNRQPPNEFS
jgi:hypothetical protein